MSKKTKVHMVSDMVDEYIDLEGRLGDVIARLQEYADTYGDAAFIERVENYGYGCNEGYHYSINVSRPENDAERAKREKREAEFAEQQRANELRQFEILKAKYGEL